MSRQKPFPRGDKTPFFTIVTPTLDSERFLDETMRTVAMQRDDGVRVEHIVVDGGSTDRTAEIVARWAHPDTRFLPGKDTGPADAINRGLREARGDYLGWLNSDDEYAPHALLRSDYILRRHPKASFCFGHCPIIDAEGREIRRFVTRFKAAWFPVSCRAAIRTLNYVSQPSVLIRRSAWEAAGPLRTDLKAAWDYDLWLRLWRRGGAVRVPGREPLAFFRWTPDSISGANYERQFAEELAVARADAGRLAPSALLHFLVARGIVFCYRRMAPRPAPDPATEKPAP